MRAFLFDSSQRSLFCPQKQTRYLPILEKPSRSFTDLAIIFPLVFQEYFASRCTLNLDCWSLWHISLYTHSGGLYGNRTLKNGPSRICPELRFRIASAVNTLSIPMALKIYCAPRCGIEPHEEEWIPIDIKRFPSARRCKRLVVLDALKWFLASSAIRFVSLHTHQHPC